MITDTKVKNKRLRNWQRSLVSILREKIEATIREKNKTEKNRNRKCRITQTKIFKRISQCRRNLHNVERKQEYNNIETLCAYFKNTLMETAKEVCGINKDTQQETNHGGQKISEFR